MLHRILKPAISCLAGLLLITSCKKEVTTPIESDKLMTMGRGNRPAPKGTVFFALTSTNEIVKYSSGNPLDELGSVSVTGLAAMENLLAIDFRPATGQLYAVSSQSRIYVVNQNTGKAVAVSMTPFSPAIMGTQVGFDFNPTVDRIRLVTNTGQNLRLNPETGLVAANDVAISPAGSMVTAVAYTNSFAGAATTTLYDIDVATDKLYIQSPPNNGVLVPVGELGVQAVGEAGFDISADNTVAIAALFGRGDEDDSDEISNGNKFRFYYINLATGEATNAGKTDRAIIGVAIPTRPVAYATDAMNKLHIFNPTVMGGIITKSITGLMAGEQIVGIDMRPATAQLYALTTASRVYAINMASAAATAIGAPFVPALSGTSFGFDFNPTVDRIRVVSNTGQNLRLNPVTGATASVDPMLNPGTPMVDAAGYTNSFAGSTTTMLFDIDHGTDKLYMQNPANAGKLVEIGSLGINISAGNGFDIGGSSNMAWGIFTVNGANGLYSVNLSTGAATSVMSFPVSARGFAVGLGF